MKISERDLTAEKTYTNNTEELKDKYPDFYKEYNRITAEQFDLFAHSRYTNDIFFPNHIKIFVG